MLYQGIIGGGSSPVEPEDLSPVLLWTNSNPSNEFAAQTISLNLTDYAGVLIECHQNNTTSYGTRVYIKKGDSFETSGITGMGYLNSDKQKGLSRDVTINDSGVTFTAGTENANNNCIPYKIYGVKKYVVEPDYGKYNVEWTAANSPYVLETNKPVQMIYFKNSSTASEYLTAYLNNDGTYSSYSTGFTFTKISDTEIKIGYSSSSEIFASGTFQVYYII